MTTHHPTDAVLTINPGSSSFKIAVIELHDFSTIKDTELHHTSIAADSHALGKFVQHLTGVTIKAVAVRLVHGGPAITSPAILDETLMNLLEQLPPSLAPLHNPPTIAAIRQTREELPDIPVVVCPDTAFFTSLPETAKIYPIPWAWSFEHGIHRYGFHGLSHAYACRRAAQIASVEEDRAAVVTAHLGAGASLSACLGGVPVDTTMGFTPLDGIAMATRPGSLDPGILLFLLRDKGIDLTEVEQMLEHGSGLAGISGVADGDMVTILEKAKEGHARSSLAISVYCHRLRAAIASMAASLGGIDVLAFTGGVGEASPAIRAKATEGLEFLGIRLSGTKNEAQGATDREISAEDSEVRTVVLQAREDLQMTYLTMEILQLGQGNEA